jgi:ubiquinone/menaquinone biosynthesis C-methylase UbiE
MHMTQIIACPPIPDANSTPGLDFAAIKTRQRAIWSSGDYAIIGTNLQIVGETLCEAIDLRSGSKVLDVACGNGNVSLAAARRFCDVTGVDYVPSLLERAAARAAAERFEIRFVEGDAERLPFEDASFDVVVSTFGVMFAPDQRSAAREMCRVCKPGGRIGLANWTPEGFIGKLLKTVTRYVPPAPGLSSPVLWGTEPQIAALFDGQLARATIERRIFNFRYASSAHFIDVFRRFYGPTHTAFNVLDQSGQAALTADLTHLIDEHNRAGSSSLVVPAEYLEIVLDINA